MSGPPPDSQGSGPPPSKFEYVPDPRGLPITAFQIQNSHTYVGVVVPLFFVSTVMVTARVISRQRSDAGLAIDDHFIIAAAVFGLVEIVCLVVTMKPNLERGASDQFRSWENLLAIAPLTMIAEVLTSWCVALVKTSIALMLVRLQQESKRWKIFLYSIIALQAVTAFFVMIVQTTRCIPTEAIWNMSLRDKWCWSPDAFKWSMTAASIIVILTDIIFSLTPLTFIHKIRRSTRHRIVIAVLMGLGIVASSASVAKTVALHRFDESADMAGHGITIALWASTEAQIGIIAACIPTLRGAFLRLLARLGIYTEFPTVVTENARSSSTWRGQEIPAGPLKGPREPAKYDAADSGRRKMWSGDDEILGDKSQPRTDSEGDDGIRPTPHGGPPSGYIERKTDIEIELSSVQRP